MNRCKRRLDRRDGTWIDVEIMEPLLVVTEEDEDEDNEE
jgi:hypothetical protein